LVFVFILIYLVSFNKSFLNFQCGIGFLGARFASNFRLKKTVQHYTMTMYASGVRAPQFVTLALDEAEWFALCPSHLMLTEKVSSTCWVEGWLDPSETEL
jgi:hypothetical protein